MAFEQIDEEKLKERVIHINRVAKVVKGGRRFSFSALVVVGDECGSRRRRSRQGQRGARGDPQGQRSGAQEHVQGSARRRRPSRTRSFGHFGAGKVLLRPASPGTGVIAGGAVRAVVESAGIHDILTKCLGTTNPHNVVHATVAALEELKAAEQIADKRDMTVDEIAATKHGAGSPRKAREHGRRLAAAAAEAGGAMR